MANDRRQRKCANPRTNKKKRPRPRIGLGDSWADLDVHDEGEAHGARYRIAGRVVTAVTAFAAIATLILLVRGDKETQSQILKLCDHILTAASGAGLALIVGGGASRPR